MKKFKYVYNTKTGHFIKKLNEDDSNVKTDTDQDNSNTNNSTDSKDDTSTGNTSFKSVEADETIQDLAAKAQENENKFQQDLNTQQKLLDAAKATASNKTPTGPYDPVMTDQNVLNIMKKINDMTKQHAIDQANFQDQKLAQLQKLSQTNESYYKIPEKYKWLNESNIHTAKIYVNNLVSTEDNTCLLRGMADFKRAFKDTDLLYGKDRNGYFLIAIDKDDFDKIYDTLEETGYMKNEIIDTIMPQLLDRHDMIQ